MDKTKEVLRKERNWLLNSYALYRSKDSAWKEEYDSKLDILYEMKQDLRGVIDEKR